ncbi:MAG: UDP-N-acetylglucosamine 2-epimerase (non-hydrolyzing) [Candidatus Heimdallarchaeota archaeon]|nr:UDP-N-acetylglucosamine 2-epimerase (non-hydrolyzing) [Candidatus Heimdallarchaeota archaeon]
MFSVVFIVGTRPEIIKIAPIILQAEKRGIKYALIHTGQHYDENMSNQFFTSLGIRKPDKNLQISDENSHVKLSEMIKKLGEELVIIKPSIVLALGDTMSVLASCLACVQTEIPFGHLEAGLRSYDLTMPEERNRRIVDSISSLYFAPSKRAVTNLYYEGVNPERIFFTGNTIVDAIRIFKDRITDENTSQADNILSTINGNFIICTVHRVSNVENIEKLDTIVSFLANYTTTPILFLIHPRTKKKITEIGKNKNLENNSNLHMYESINYFSMLKLMTNEKCLMILTDSGGLQEEAAVLRKPCLTLRSNTERPETVIHEINKLVEIQETNIVREIQRVLSEDFEFRFNQFQEPYGDGHASEKILDIIESFADDLSFISPSNYKQGSKTFHLLELGTSLQKEEIEDQFECQISIVYDGEGNPKVIKDKLKKGDRVRILKD